MRKTKNPTWQRGIEELNQLSENPAAGRVRQKGAGRKNITPESEVEQNLKSLLETRTAGDPDDEEIVFTKASCRFAIQTTKLSDLPTKQRSFKTTLCGVVSVFMSPSFQEARQ